MRDSRSWAKLPNQSVWVLVIATVILAQPVFSQPTQGEAVEPSLLTARPLCEASAALVAPWDDEELLVADNELDEQLFVFSIEGERLEPELTLSMPDGRRPDDIEALARVGESLLVVGSHSRNSRCEERPKRQRMRILTRRDDGTLEAVRLIDDEERWAEAREGEAECLAELFVDPAPDLTAETCRSLLAAEAAAAAGMGCPVLNIEGALSTPDGRVWLGLRAPLVEGRAALLRLTPELDALRFDQVALLALEDRGIRGLGLGESADGEGEVYGIAGPTEDASDPFAFFSITLETVRQGGKLEPEILRRDLPTSSEGMAIADRRAWTTIDGDEGEPTCRAPSGQYSIVLGD